MTKGAIWQFCIAGGAAHKAGSQLLNSLLNFITLA